MRTYSDAHLEHYADRFIGLRLARHGVNLEQYLANPRRYEKDEALKEEPLLPAQERAIARLWWEQDTGLARELPSTAVAPQWSDSMIRDWRAHLAQWRDAQAKVEGDIAHLPRQDNGHIVEPLKHHRYPRSSTANFAKRNA